MGVAHAIDAGAANDPGSSQIRAPRAGFAAQVAAAGFIRCAGLNKLRPAAVSHSSTRKLVTLELQVHARVILDLEYDVAVSSGAAEKVLAEVQLDHVPPAELFQAVSPPQTSRWCWPSSR